MKSIPKTQEPYLDIQQLADDLRNPNGGCPWDLSQNHKSVIKNLIEETYEVVDILNDIDDHPEKYEELKEELGDLFFQIVFHVQLAKEKNKFGLDDVIQSIINKLIYRHPHVYGEDNSKTKEEVLTNWEKIKIKEKKNKNKDTSILSGIPTSLPALLKSYRMGQKASRLGFDWENNQEILLKLEEELQEFENATSIENAEEEFGDILFCLVQYARKKNIDPEKALQKVNLKFKKRFQIMEDLLQKEISADKNISIEAWDKAWREAKKN